jgi:hypothetical protein
MNIKNQHEEIISIVSKLLRKTTEVNREEMLTALSLATLRSLNEDNTIIRFDYPGDINPDYRTRLMEVAGEVSDEDGERIEIFLYKRPDGLISELELLKVNGDVIAPAWDKSFQIE